MAWPNWWNMCATWLWGMGPLSGTLAIRTTSGTWAPSTPALRANCDASSSFLGRETMSR